MRLFVPATMAMLETLLEAGEMPVRSGTAFAATPALIESYAEGDMEEIEHVAFLEAARASLRLLGGELDSGAAHEAHPYRRAAGPGHRRGAAGRCHGGDRGDRRRPR